MDIVDALAAVRYWCKILHCIIPNALNDIEVKVTDLEISCCFLLKFLNIFISQCI